MNKQDKINALEKVKEAFLLRATKGKISTEDKEKYLAEVDKKLAELKGE